MLNKKQNIEGVNSQRLFPKLKNTTYLIWGLVFTGLLLRLPALGLGLWRDEGSTYFNSLPTNLAKVIKTVVYSELNPPGFYLLMSGWIHWFGTQEIVFKLPALLFGLLLIPVIYVTGKAAFSRKVGLIAAMMIAFSPEAIYYSQEARPYSLAALLSCLTVLFYLKLLTGEYHKRRLMGFLLCASMLLYVQYTGLLLVTSLAILTVFLRFRRVASVGRLPLLISFIMIMVLFIPWIPIFLIHLNTGAPWKAEYSWLGRLKVFYYNISYTIPTLRFHSVGALVVLSILIISGLKRIPFVVKRNFRYKDLLPDKSATILGACFLLPAMFLATRSLYGRYMFSFAPFAWILYSHWLIILFRYIENHLIVQWFNRSRAIMIFLFIVVFIVPNSIQAILWGNKDKSGIRSLATDMHGKYRGKTLYLVSPDYLGPTCGYYFAGQNISLNGFARWYHPELFSPLDYVEIWNRPGLTEEILQRIRYKSREGYDKLVLIHESGVVRDYGKMKYSRSNNFLSVLKQTYRLIEKADYPGMRESVTFYLFALIPGTAQEK